MKNNEYIVNISTPLYCFFYRIEKLQGQEFHFIQYVLCICIYMTLQEFRKHIRQFFLLKHEQKRNSGKLLDKLFPSITFKQQQQQLTLQLFVLPVKSSLHFIKLVTGLFAILSDLIMEITNQILHTYWKYCVHGNRARKHRIKSENLNIKFPYLFFTSRIQLI